MKLKIISYDITSIITNNILKVISGVGVRRSTPGNSIQGTSSGDTSYAPITSCPSSASTALGLGNIFSFVFFLITLRLYLKFYCKIYQSLLSIIFYYLLLLLKYLCRDWLYNFLNNFLWN